MLIINGLLYQTYIEKVCEQLSQLNLQIYLPL